MTTRSECFAEIREAYMFYAGLLTQHFVAGVDTLPGGGFLIWWRE